MTTCLGAPLWQRPGLREAAGDTLRPGGFVLTDRGARFMDLAPGQRVLDVGCGLGATLHRLRARYGASAWGIEPSAGQLARAGDTSHMARALGDALPFRGGAFRALFCECVLSLFADMGRGLKEFYRVLEPGGYLVLSDLCALSDRGAGPCRGNSCASRAAPLAEVRNLVEEGGFTVEVVEDHTQRLRELAARLVMAGEDCACTAPMGYFLIIASKGGSCNG